MTLPGVLFPVSRKRSKYKVSFKQERGLGHKVEHEKNTKSQERGLYDGKRNTAELGYKRELGNSNKLANSRGNTNRYCKGKNGRSLN